MDIIYVYTILYILLHSLAFHLTVPVFYLHRLSRFADSHRSAHVLGLAPIHGPQERQALSELQTK